MPQCLTNQHAGFALKSTSAQLPASHGVSFWLSLQIGLGYRSGTVHIPYGMQQRLTSTLGWSNSMTEPSC